MLGAFPLGVEFTTQLNIVISPPISNTDSFILLPSKP